MEETLVNHGLVLWFHRDERQYDADGALGKDCVLSEVTRVTFVGELFWAHGLPDILGDRKAESTE